MPFYDQYSDTESYRPAGISYAATPGISKYALPASNDPEELAIAAGRQFVKRRAEVTAGEQSLQSDMQDWSARANAEYNDVLAQAPTSYNPPAPPVQVQYQPSPSYVSNDGSYNKDQVAQIPGLMIPGNIDLRNRPKVRNPDGTTSTVRSMSFEDIDGNEVLIPTISPEGDVLTPDQAIKRYRDTGEHLGVFKDAASATQAALQIHDQQAQTLGEPSADNELIARAPSRSTQYNAGAVQQQNNTGMSPQEFIANNGNPSQAAAPPTSVDQARSDIRAAASGGTPSTGGLANILDVLFGKHDKELYK